MTDDLFAKMKANSIDLTRAGMTPLQEAARENDMVIVIGYQQLDGAVCGSIHRSTPRKPRIKIVFQQPAKGS